MHSCTGPVSVRNYAVEPVSILKTRGHSPTSGMGRYHLRVMGPNGFFREFIGGPDDPRLDSNAGMADCRPTEAA